MGGEFIRFIYETMFEWSHFDLGLVSFCAPIMGTYLKKESSEKLHVKCTLTGEPARIVLELKERGIVRSVREAMVHGILAFYERTAERDLKRAQASASLRLQEEAYS